MWFRDLLTPTSRLRYVAWRAMPWPPRSITVKFSTGQYAILPSHELLDLGTVYEVFVAQDYRSPRGLGGVRRIVDVGANVGHSVVYWARHYPEARIEAIEPHPRHAKLLGKVVKLNRLGDRVTIHTVAAGTRDGRSFLTDDTTASTLRDSAGGGAIEVPVVDFFERFGNAAIDLLKLDCEGAELDLMMDPRFADLNAKALVVEWHETPGAPRAKERIVDRLRAIGWQLEIGRENGSPAAIRNGQLLATGLIWGYRS